jgi:hypothetical protein
MYRETDIKKAPTLTFATDFYCKRSETLLKEWKVHLHENDAQSDKLLTWLEVKRLKISP